MLIHSTTLDIAGLGVIVLGDTNTGKSDLALRAIAEGAWLVADDQTQVEIRQGGLWASCPPAIFAKLEARNVGVIPAPAKSATKLALAVMLGHGALERLPEAQSWHLPGNAKPAIPLIKINPFEASATAKLRGALETAVILAQPIP